MGRIVHQGGEGTWGNPPDQYIGMANNQGQKPNLDRYVVIHVATTCDEHGVYVTKDSAEVIELGWILLDAKSCDEVHFTSLSDLFELKAHAILALASPGECPC